MLKFHEIKTILIKLKIRYFLKIFLNDLNWTLKLKYEIDCEIDADNRINFFNELSDFKADIRFNENMEKEENFKSLGDLTLSKEMYFKAFEVMSSIQ